MPAYREHEDDAIIPHAMVLIDAMRDIHALDWTPDQAYPKQGRAVRYVTTAKIKRQITPVLDKYGIRIVQTVREAPVITETGAALVHYRFSIFHREAPVGDPVDVWSEGVNDIGKRLLTASTNAYRIYALQTFGLIDGMEDEPPQQGPNPAARISPMPERTDNPAQAPQNGPQDARTPQQVSEPVQTAVCPQNAENMPQEDVLSPLMRQAVSNAYQKILASPQTADVLQEARARYDAIQSQEDARRFLEYKQEVLG